MTTVNNLNIFTFIKDIYQSLKHIDKTMTLSNDDLNKRISKLEDNQQIVIDKLATIETILNKLSEMNKPNNGLDKNIEFELLEKMKKINLNEVNNSKLALKPNELTFANILENNYGFNDINNSLGSLGSLGNTISDENRLDNINAFTTFTAYTPYTDTYNTYNNSEDILENQNNINNTNTNTNTNTQSESLDTLLF